MALLINKLFSSKKKVYIKHTDIGDRSFSFSKEQVRVVLFRECDFRGRKLLFDSQTVQKVPLAPNNKIIITSATSNQFSNKGDIFVEISNGFGYQYSRPSCDTVILGETVFGSVAMSYQGSSFKIHSFSSPARLMCTQVFPSPKVRVRSRCTTTNNTSVTSSNSSGIVVDRSGKSDYSSTSSTTSFNEPNLGHSTDSNNKFASTGSVPLDVPLISGDSGFCGEQSYNSLSSGNDSLTLLDARFEHVNMISFSCGSLYKRWMRSSSTSLGHNSCSDLSLGTGGSQNSASADGCLMRNHHRASKLGLAIILLLTENKESAMESFLLKHAALIEAMVFRARTGAEMAYMKPGAFASLMFDIHQEICQYLFDLLTGNTIELYLWHEIRSRPTRTQPKHNFLTSTLFNFTKTRSENNLVKYGEVKRTRTDSCNSDFNFKVILNNSFSGLNLNEEQCDNKSGYIDTYKKYNSSHFADFFIKELCELLEMLEVKQKNFFISTLLTAVLTHHLGWVSTVCTPTKEDKEIISKMQSPCNPLWGQLSDLYGAVGHPTKMARTVICGSNKGDVIERILNILTYFIRCSTVERNNLRNFNICDLKLESIEDDLNMLQNISYKTISTVTSENFKISQNLSNTTIENLEMKTLKVSTLEVVDTNQKSKKTNIEIQSHSNSSIENASIYKKTSGLKSMKKSTSYVGNLFLQSDSFSDNYNDENNDNLGNTEQKDSVVFVLGENEELKGLKKSSESINKIPKENEPISVLCINKNLEIKLSKPKFSLNNSSDDESASNDDKFAVKNSSKREIDDKISKGDEIYKNESPKNISYKPTFATENSPKHERFCVLKEVKKDSSVDVTDCNLVRQRKKGFIVTDDNKIEMNLFTKENNILRNNDLILEDDLKLSESTRNKTEKMKSLRKISEDESKKNYIPIENKNLNIPSCSKTKRPTDLNLPTKLFSTYSDSSPDSPCVCDETSPCSECEKVRKRSSSLQPNDINDKIINQATKIALESDFDEPTIEIKRREGCDRSQSVPPSDKKRKCSKAGCKKKYAGVKFDMRQYPQIVTNYMKSKDLELSQLPFGEKSLKLSRSFSTTLFDNCLKDLPTCDCEHDTEVLTTPSNASELEFTSDLECDKYDFLGSKTKSDFGEEKPSTSTENGKSNPVVVVDHPLQENNAIFEQEIEYCDKKQERSNMVFSEYSLPSIDIERLPKNDPSIGYTHTLLRGINSNYISDMILQGTTSPQSSWEQTLKRDLRLTARQPLLDQPIQEAVAIVANTDTWEVQLVSSHSYIVERGCIGVRICLSQLVASMLESLLHMWKLKTPTEQCLMHIESKLQEFCQHSKTMAQILMNTEFCNMDMLTSALQLEVNDIPLLMAVASTHTPKVTQKYGLSFQ